MRKRIALTVDGIVCRGKGAAREILLIRRGREPFKGKWALPGGFVEYWETVESAAVREVFEETGLKAKIAGLVGVYSDPKRDPRGRVISVAYFALIGTRPRLYSDTDAMAANWFSINPVRSPRWGSRPRRLTSNGAKRLPQLAFDHRKIVNYALKRLCSKLEYSNITCNLLPKYFTLSELQEVYEIILGKKIDKRNFRKKISALNLLESSKKRKREVSYRPPLLYKFKTRKPIVLAKREITF